jgi:hypothetical protein
MSTLRTDNLNDINSTMPLNVKDIVLNAEAYTSLGAYTAGLVFTTYTQTFTYLGVAHYPKKGVVLPYTTTGVGAAEVATFRSVGDATLRADLAAPSGASLVGYMPGGTGAVASTAQNKLREVVSVLDFGARGDGVFNNLTAINAAIAAAGDQKTIKVPVDSAGGDYAITSGTLTIPSTARFEYEAGSRIYGAGGTLVDKGRHFHLFGGGLGEHRQDTITKGFALELNNTLSGVGQGGSSSTYMINRLFIADDKLDAQTDAAPGSKVDGLIVQHVFGGAGTRGGRHAIEGIINQSAATELDNIDNHYVGVQGAVYSAVSDGGTLGAEKGSYFGMSSFAQLSGASTNSAHVNGCEFNSGLFGGASSRYRAGSSFVSMGDSQGYVYDAAVAIGALGLTGAQWQDGILAGVMNGRQPISRSLIRNACNAPAIISHPGDIPPNLIVSDTDTRFKFRVDNLQMFYANAAFQLGAKGATNAPSIQFNSGATSAPSYDTRIIATGGTGTDGQGTLILTSSTAAFTGVVRPNGDNVTTLGTASNRWSIVYAATGTINTSDENAKQQTKPIDAAALRAWANVEYLQYKFNDSVAEKGDGARWHFGVIAQRVQEAFAAEGLDAFDYGLLCYDEWDAVAAVYDAEGDLITPATAAGNRYGVRYEEALVLECAYLRSRLA